MAAATSPISPLSNAIFEEFMDNFHPRRLLRQSALYNSPPLPSPPPSHDTSQPRDNDTFDANVVMALSVLLCALICSIGLYSMIRCALRCSSLVVTDSNSTGPSVRLANTGIKKKVLGTFPTISYATDLKLPGLDTECAICLSDFAPEEQVRVLPKCNHGFHVSCIDKWLTSHSSCPTCRHCLIETCNKIVGSSQAAASFSTPSPPTHYQEVVVSIEPLRPEALIRNHET